ncbi:hypothetical protein C4587_00925 [Candidatus Parcubacteria bacterium]|nr:MAG: hypothetical protein C4587_00925 [Candidatus Parcubacteria bacterium]
MTKNSLHTGGVTGSIPVPPTIKQLKLLLFAKSAKNIPRKIAQNGARTWRFDPGKIRGKRPVFVLEPARR